MNKEIPKVGNGQPAWHISNATGRGYRPRVWRNKTKGKHPTKLYRIWSGMKRRCYTKGHHAYHLYGGAGIRVCDEWLDFGAFRDWALANGFRHIDACVDDQLSIDRIDPDGDYCPKNCRFITRRENATRKRAVHGEQSPAARHSDEVVRRCVEMVESGMQQIEVAAITGIRQTTISKWVLRKSRRRTLA